jgi:hypothetical protein
MPARAILVPLLVPLLSMLACTKEERLPLAAATSTTGFEYAGRLVTCEATATTSASYSLRSIGPNSYVTTDTTEIVSLTLNAVLEGQKDPPALLLSYERPSGQPDTAYHLTIVTYLSGNPNEAAPFFDHITGTLRDTSTGFFEGAFTNTKPGSSPLSEGRFTHVPVVKRY